MGAPATLPANFFEGKTGQATPPKTLPANFDFKKGAAPTPDTSAERGAAQATGLRAAKPMSVAEMADTPFVKDMLAKNVGAGEFGAGMLAGAPIMKGIAGLFKPTTSMVPEVSKLLGPSGKPLINMIEKQGPSAAGKAAGLTKEAVKKILTWANKNPTQSYLIYKGLEGLGIAPHKVAKMLHVVAKD
jgi:hypothetical protein